MDCTNCSLFKETFGKNIRIENPVIDCSVVKNDKCLINKVLQESSHAADILSDTISYDDPEYAKKLNDMAIQYALDIFDIDSFSSQIARMHDEQMENTNEL